MRVILYLLAIIGLFTVYELARPYVIDLFTHSKVSAEQRQQEIDDATAKIEARKKAGKFYDIK